MHECANYHEQAINALRGHFCEHKEYTCLFAGYFRDYRMECAKRFLAELLENADYYNERGRQVDAVLLRGISGMIVFWSVLSFARGRVYLSLSDYEEQVVYNAGDIITPNIDPEYDAAKNAKEDGAIERYCEVLETRLQSAIAIIEREEVKINLETGDPIV